MYRRIFALILAFVMAFSLVPVTAFATEEAQKTEPVVTEPMVSEPKATEPKATEPVATEPKATEPKATEPKATEPKATEPKATEPKATEPAATEPAATEPAATEPAATEPQATEPKATEPKATEPQATEAKATEPKATEPAVTEPSDIGSNPTAPTDESNKTRAGEEGDNTLTISLSFAEDSVFDDDDIGDIEASIYIVEYTEEGGYDPQLVKTVTLNKENGRTVTLPLVTGEYELYFTGYEMEGYLYSGLYGENIVLSGGSVQTISREIKYFKDEGTLTISLAFAKNSAFGDKDIGIITAGIYSNGTLVEELFLTEANGRTDSIPLRSGSYEVKFSGYEKEKYLCGLEENVSCYLYPEEQKNVSREVCYYLNETTLTVSLAFAEGSVYGDSDVGDITATVYDANTSEQVTNLTLSQENGRTDTVTLPRGNYRIEYSGYEKDGSSCSLEQEDMIYLLFETEGTISRNVNYFTGDLKVMIDLSVADNSLVSDVDFESIDIELEGNGVYERKALDSSGTAEFVLPVGSYRVTFFGAKHIDPYYCRIDGKKNINVPYGETINEQYTIAYVENEAVLTVALDFAEGSELDGDDIGSITAEVYNVDTDKLAGTLVLNAENGWQKKLTVLAKGADEGTVGYYLKFSDYEREGYWGTITDDGHMITPLPGDEVGWNVIAKYAKAENRVTLNVRLSEESNVSYEALAGCMLFDLNEASTEKGTRIWFDGSAEFSYTFTDLIAPADYKFAVRQRIDDSMIVGAVSLTIQSITCTGSVVRQEVLNGETDFVLENGQLNFTMDGNCTIDVVITATQPQGSLTVVARFAEESVLQKEDFPDGISIQMVYGAPQMTTYLGPSLLASSENGWTNTVTITDRVLYMVVEQIDGYIADVTFVDEGIYGIVPSECPTTIYADICFREREPYYMDVEIVFAEESALKGTAAGSIFLDINDSGTVKNIEFSEATSWHKTVELNGKYNGVNWSDWYSMALSGLDRAGYSYTVKGVSSDVPQNDEINWEYVHTGDSARRDLWNRGDTKYLTLEICYTLESGMLVVNTFSSLYGLPCDTTITVTDADGNVVAEKDTENYQCVIELSEVGEYTISQTVKEDEYKYSYYADGPKTIQFDPAIGAAVRLLNERRGERRLQLRKVFYSDSALSAADFPDGITIVLTESTGAFSGTYVLNNANGWGTDVFVPEGIYTVSELNADKPNYTRHTEFVFKPYLSSGGRSISSPSGNRESGNNSTAAATAEGGPFYITGDVQTVDLIVFNTYTADPGEPDASNGSITITAGDAFYIYGGDKLPGNPSTGHEAEAYTYRVVIDGEEQTVTLKPGETMTLDGIKAGTQYSITPVLPDGYVWNASDATISGTVGSDPEDEESLNVKVNFDNDYYYDYEDSNLTILKTDALTDEALKGAKFGLYADAECTKKLATATTGKDGTCGFTITEAGTYYVKELKAPETYYVKSTEVMTVTAEEEWVKEDRDGTRVLVAKMAVTVEGLSTQDGAYIWENERKTTDISVTKKFAHDEDLERPDSVTIVLYQDGEAYDTVKLSKANNWKHVWEDMPLGFEYTVDEVNVAKGYYKQIRSSGYDFTVINSGHWNPQTGDDSMIALWISTATLSLVALAVLNEKKRRQRV